MSLNKQIKLTVQLAKKRSLKAFSMHETPAQNEAALHEIEQRVKKYWFEKLGDTEEDVKRAAEEWRIKNA